MIAMCLLLAIAKATAPAWADDGDGNYGTDSAYMPWGDPAWTTNDYVCYPWPNWMVAAFQSGGAWQTNPPAWHVPPWTSNDVGCLQMDVDRSLLMRTTVRH